LAQARYRWWCKWHALDPDCFSELARQGKDINDWVGRENTGWWRLRAPRQRDSINKHKGKARREGAKPEAQHLLTSFKPQPIEVFEAEAWSDTRQNPWGWGTRKYFEQNPFYDYGITIPGLECEPYYNQLGRWNDEATTLSPFTLAFLLGSIQIRYFSFKLVQEDFLFALGLLLKREGAVDREPDWRFWLLEAFGLTRKRAAIRIYEPEPDRDLIRNVGWAKRDWPFFLYRLSWLRELHHGYKPSVYEGPRPTLLVGTPGTGKTSRVRIFADESKTPIIYQSLNAFGEATKIFTRLGIGKNTSANSVKRGFIEARRRTPVIYFLDELDALGAKRPTTFRDIRNITLPTGRLEDWEKERDETIDEREERKFLKQRDEEDQDKEGDRLFGLTQLLKEIDSPLQNKGILFIGATNRPQVLDPALIRPGRFANIRVIPPPNRVKRLSILKLYRGRLRAPLSVDWQFLAARTATYNGAHLACLANQAAIQAILYHQGPGTPIIQDRHFDKALRILRDNTSIKHKTTPERKRDTAELIPWERVAKAYYRAAAAVVSWSLKGDEGLAGVILEHDKLPIDPNQYETKPQGVETRLDQRNNLAVYRAGRASLTALQRTWAPDISKATEKSVYTLLDSRAAVRHARSLVNTKYQKRTLWYWKEIEFIKDRYLGEYTVQHENTGRLEPRSKNTPLPETALETVYSAWEYEEWACEWFDFEGPEYNTWRSILWIPPEVHIIDPHQFGPKLKLGRAGNIIPKYYEQYVFDYIGNAYRRALKALDNNRAALDLYAAFLLKHGTLSRTNGKKLAPGIWEKGDSPQLQK
jgi:cell division protease FtsH